MKKPINPIILGLKRFFRTNFDKDDLRSESASIEEFDTQIVTKDDMRTNWNTRATFLLYAIGYTMGFGKIWRFPWKVYNYGLSTFLCFYILNCICFGFPLLILEFGVGQFSGRGCTHVFSMVPLLIGVGWSMLLMSMLIAILFSVGGAWAYFYFFSSFQSELPWSHCNNYFNSFSCVSSYMGKGYENETAITSAKEYFQYHVVGYKLYPSGENIAILNSPSMPSLLMTISLALVYIIPVVINVYGTTISGRILKFTVLCPYFVVSLLIMRTLSLDGGMVGVRYFFSFPFDNVVEVFHESLEQLLFSLGLGMGVMITLSSYNNFHDNIIFDIFIIILIDIFTSILLGIAVFSAIGCHAYRSGIAIDKVVTSEWEFYLVIFPTLFANIYGENFWVMIIMLMLICVSLDAHMGFLSTITVAIFDFFPDFQKNIYSKVVSEILISIVLFFVTFMLITPAGAFWIYFFNFLVVQKMLSLLVLLEIVIVVWIYGSKNFSKDYKIMMKYTICRFWMVMMKYLEPIFVVSHVIYDLVMYSTGKKMENSLPWGITIIIWTIQCVFIFPIVLGMIHTLALYRLHYPQLSIRALLRETLKPSPEWGPYHKIDWLSSSRYRNKLIFVYDNPMFQTNMKENEEIGRIIKEIS